MTSSSPQRIHLDYLSGTPLLPEARVAMAAALSLGNPSSMHETGQQAREAVEQAREQVAGLLGAKPSEIYFTSCGTESNNWALRGLSAANRRKGNHLIVSAIEHPSVSLTARRLELDGLAKVDTLPVDASGRVSVASLKAVLRPETVLVSIMLANGEVGTVQPVQELAAVAHEHGALFHTDAVAAAGHWPIDVAALGVDALSLAAPQLYGPQGAAALFVRERLRILPLLEGGGQEQGGRSGTEPVPAIAGFGGAAKAARRDLPGRAARLARLRDRLRDGLAERITGLRVNGDWASRLPHNLHVCVEGASSEALVRGLDHAGISAGLGSACNAKAMRPSHVLKAMGLTEEQAAGALVFTVGEPTTEQEIDRALEIIPAVVRQIRNVAALTVR